MPGLSRLDVAMNFGAATPNRDATVDIHGDTAYRANERLETLEINQHPVIDLKPGCSLDGLLGGLSAGILHPRIEITMFRRVCIDRIQHAGTIATAITLGEAIMQWRVAGKWHRLQIARQADQHGPAGFGINTCHGHAVWPESTAIPPGVAAHQQDVVAPVLGDLVAAATEDSRRQVMLRRDHRGDSDEAPEDRERHSKAEH